MAKKKLKKNLSGLQNQKASNFHAELEEALDDMANIDEQSDNEDTEWNAKIRLDSIKPCWDASNDSDDSKNSELDLDLKDEGGVEDEVMEAGEDEWRNEGLQVGLMVLAIEIRDDPRDEDWIPDSLRWKHNARLAKGMFSLII